MLHNVLGSVFIIEGVRDDDEAIFGGGVDGVDGDNL